MLKIKLTESRPKDVSRDAFRAACKAAFVAAGWFWFNNFLRRHFDPVAQKAYNYRPRARATRGKKLGLSKRGIVKKGGQASLVFSGRTEEAVTRRAVVQGFPTRAKVTTFAPSYIRTNYRSANMPQMIKEITRVTAAEKKELAKVFKKVLVEEFKKYKRPKTTKIG